MVKDILTKKREDIVSYFVSSIDILNRVNHPNFYLTLCLVDDTCLEYVLTFNKDDDVILENKTSNQLFSYSYDEFLEKEIHKYELIETSTSYDLSFEIDINPCSMCQEVRKFEINGITADIYDFGEVRDIRKQQAPQFGCGYLTLVKYSCIPDGVLQKYGINVLNFDTLADEIYQKVKRKKCDFCR